MGGLRCNETHHGKVIATQKPQMRTILWQTGLREHLMFPHSQYVMYYTRSAAGPKYHFNRMHVSFSLEEFTCAPNERQYGLPLANYDVGLAICFYEWPGFQDLKEFAQRLIAQYWSSPFQDYRDSFSHWLNTYDSQQPNFKKDWTAASKERNYQWLLDQHLIQPPYMVTLKNILAANKCLTEDIDYLPNLQSLTKDKQQRIKDIAHRKWLMAGAPEDNSLSERFWAEAEKELIGMEASAQIL